MRKSASLCSLLLISFFTTAQTYKVEEITYDFEVKEIDGINSKYDDFSPVIFKNQLIITSGRESNLVLQGENNWGKTGFLNVFSSSFKGELNAETKFSKPTLFSEDISNNNHSGPVCFSETGDTIFFTRLEEIKRREKKERRPQLYLAIREGSNWKEVQKLPFCKEENSFGHPAWDRRKKELYFASDMNGGKGGKDLYKVKLTEDGWGQPTNLQDLNTASDELFPFIIESDLFFSSNREEGQGQLDIYWKVLGHEQKVLPAEINSAGDDHGIFILPGQSKGLFSRRLNDVDNVYYLNIKRSVLITNELAGQFTYRNLEQSYAAGLDIQLIHEDEVVMKMTTDEQGQFAFRNLPFENYTIKIVGEEDVELTLFDKSGAPITNLLQDGNGLFQYKKIDFEAAGTLSMLKEMNQGISMDFSDISGQFVFENIPGMYGDSLKVMLVDEDGNIVFTEYSDARGNFTFKNIPLDKNYTITTETVEEDMFLFIYNEKGEVYTQLKSNENGQYVFKKIKQNYANNLQYLAVNEDVFEIETMTLTGNFNYKKLEGQFNEGLTVYLYSEDGFLLDSAVTDQYGHFMFNSLDPDQFYLLKMNEDDPSFLMGEFNLHVEDRFGNVMADLYRAEDGFFRFKQINLDSENLALKNVNEDDNINLELKPPKTDVAEEPNIPFSGDLLSIYFELNSSFANFKENGSLNEIIQKLKDTDSKVHINAYADSRSSDQYNMWLSERRGKRVKEYLIRKGISESRIEMDAFGESRIENDCGNGLPCSDEEHQKNRRVDLLIQK